MKATTPIPLTERYQILDVHRGFALLGVMLDNLFGFTGWAFASEARKQATNMEFRCHPRHTGTSVHQREILQSRLALVWHRVLHHPLQKRSKRR
jgi:hypothetical protein